MSRRLAIGVTKWYVSGRRSALIWSCFMGIGVGTISSCYWKSYIEVKNYELSQNRFIPYKISHKENIDGSHFMLELTPLHPQRSKLWCKTQIWSVEVKQPEVMVVRRYTPLPLKFNSLTDSWDVHNGDRLSFYLRYYSDGEVARWLHSLPLGHILQLRGPFVEYKLPEHSTFDINMFTAGTGIVTALQLLLAQNCYQGTVQLYHSCKALQELGPLNDCIAMLKQRDRLKLHAFESLKGNRLQPKILKNMISSPSVMGNISTKPILSLVCGPGTYIAAICGPKYYLEQGPIKGVLAEKGWDSENVYKLS